MLFTSIFHLLLMSFSILSALMIKFRIYLFYFCTDAESQQREERLSALPAHYPRPKPRPSVAPENHLTTKKPPVKPRRSIKCRPTAQQETEQLNQGQQKENEVNLSSNKCVDMT